MACFARRSSGALISVFVPVAFAAALGASPARATVFDIQSSAYDVKADLSVLGVASLSVGPFVQASGLAPPHYDVSNSLLTASGGGDLGVATLTVSTGAVSASASSPYPTPTSTASSSIDDLSIALTTTAIIPVTLLNISAKTIASTSFASDVTAPPSAVGSSTIEDLTISGLLVGLTPITITGTVNPTPNDVLLDLGGLTITLNQQIMESNGGGGVSIETNALAINLAGSLFGASVINGDIIVGNSVAMVPEPATWIEMLAGFGGLGFVAFARAKRKATVAGA